LSPPSKVSKVDRRQFLGAASAATGIATLGTGRTTGEADPLGVRDDFPVTAEGIYLDSAYITPPPTSVVEAGARFLEAKARRPISLDDMLDRTDAVRDKFARLVGVSIEEIGFLYATSEGENIVARQLGLQRGDNVVVDELHYLTTYVLYKHLEETAGIELRVAPQRAGEVPVAEFERLVDERTRLISVAWVSHQNGFRHDMKSLAELAHSHDAYLYTDAIQAVGMFPMNLRKIGVDFLTSGTYKWLLAGYGVAPFFVRRELLDRIRPDRRGALHVEKELGDYRYQLYRSAKGFEYATLAFGAVYQLGAALDYLERVGVDRIAKHTIALAQRARTGLIERGFQVLTPPGNASSIVAFAHGRDPEATRRVVEESDIKVSFREDGKQIRVSVALFNNDLDVDRFLEVMGRLS
jgi:selenocysteine lyase/cysteine desulfurase